MIENINTTIRKHRKAMNLTQEQLAEAVGVTVGAVSKWESGLSFPDISMLPTLADFFEISIDVLLGYQVVCRTVQSATQKIHELTLAKSYEKGMLEAEKAIQRFPHNFDLVYKSALLYHLDGVECKHPASLKKALSLYNQACELISQNTDPLISEPLLQTAIGEIYVSLGEIDHAIEHMIHHNYCGVNNAMIGYLQTYQQQYKEAVPYLSTGYIESISSLFYATLGLAACFQENGNLSQAMEVLTWMNDLLKGVRYPDTVSYIDRFISVTLTLCAIIATLRKDLTQAEKLLTEAMTIAKRFDESPSYSLFSIKFYTGEDKSIGDDIGETTLQGIEELIYKSNKETPALTDIWRRLNNE